MRFRSWVLLLAGILVLGAWGLPVRTAAGAEPDLWRYRYHNGEWWYWMPGEHWVYWRDNHWNDYNPSTFVLPAPATTRDAGSSASRWSRVTPRSYQVWSPPDDSDQIGPYYGHAASRVGVPWSASGGERIGPFYGHAMPSNVEGSGSVITSEPDIGPFYDHAMSHY